MTPPTFADCAGRTWLVRFTPGAVRAIRAALGIDLERAVQVFERPVRVLLNPTVRLTQVAAACCHRQREERLITPEEFGRAMTDPDTYERAGRAILEALAQYFPRSPFGRRYLYGLAAMRGQVPTTTN